ncbi:MAG: Hsp20/alpha crystallin family protein [Candidatus Latescibacterota bacterium]|nr:MAG: Hsp20/alpha crystallin family protein [Candidatus Latescibacterota bacterium]
MFLTKYKPNSTLESIFDSFDRQFFPILRSWSRDDDGEAFRLPLTNINETEKEYVITMEMPGVEKKDVDVSVDGDELVISAERSGKVESEGLLRSEIRSEKFRRSFSLGRTVDRDNIKAKLENGVLKVTLAKKAESVGRKVDVA